MQGISGKVANFGLPENKSKYNSYEVNNYFELNLYESFYRLYDYQIGRFAQIDPSPNIRISLFASMENDPISKFDILGDTSIKGNNSKAKLEPRNSKQDKLLTPGEIKKLKDFGWDHSDKGKGGGKKDLYKDKNGNIYEKAKGNKGPGEPTGINIKELDKDDQEVNNEPMPKVNKAVKNTAANISDSKNSKRPWWSPVEAPFDPISGVGTSNTIPSPKVLDKITKPALFGVGAYVLLKIIEGVIVGGTGGAAAPILIF